MPFLGWPRQPIFPTGRQRVILCRSPGRRTSCRWCVLRPMYRPVSCLSRVGGSSNVKALSILRCPVLWLHWPNPSPKPAYLFSRLPRIIRITFSSRKRISTRRFVLWAATDTLYVPDSPKLYGELSSWFHLLSSPFDYAEEAEFA